MSPTSSPVPLSANGARRRKRKTPTRNAQSRARHARRSSVSSRSNQEAHPSDDDEELSLRGAASGDHWSASPANEARASQGEPVSSRTAVPGSRDTPLAGDGDELPGRDPNTVPSDDSRKVRNMCWTLFIPESFSRDDTVRKLLAGFESWKPVTYAGFGVEQCPSTGRIHLQGYTHFRTQATASSLRKFFRKKVGFTGSVFYCKGSPMQNVNYCRKEGRYHETGDFSSVPNGSGVGGKGGRKQGMSKVVEILNKRGRVADVFNYSGLSYQQLKMAKELVTYHPGRKASTDAVIVNWFYGASGTGKSSVARDLCKGDIYSPPTAKFWEGYDGQTFVLLDDIRGDFCKFHQLLKLLDIYPLRVEVKGGSRQLWATTIFVTAPYDPESMWANRTSEDMEQLTRRCHNIIQFLKPDEFEETTSRYTASGGMVYGYKAIKGRMLTQEDCAKRAQPVTETPLGNSTGRESDGDDLEAEAREVVVVE